MSQPRIALLMPIRLGLAPCAFTHLPRRCRTAVAISLALAACSGSPELRTSVQPGASISAAERIAIVPARIGRSNDMVLPDALGTELMSFGLRVVDRSTLSQLASERGMDLTEILNGEEYFKLGPIAEVSTIVIVNPTMAGTAVANASVRVVDVATGSILLSTTYTQPAADNPGYARHDTILETAAKLAAPIADLLR